MIIQNHLALMLDHYNIIRSLLLMILFRILILIVQLEIWEPITLTRFHHIILISFQSLMFQTIRGNNVVINWSRSALDYANGGTINQYAIWRLQNWAKEPWEYIGSTPAQHFEEYAYIAPTISDSTSAGIPYYTFLVTAKTLDPNIYYNSEPDSGYSVDNLPPLPPTGLTGHPVNNTIVLSWNPSTDD